jgi:hypothetical protein
MRHNFLLFLCQLLFLVHLGPGLDVVLQSLILVISLNEVSEKVPAPEVILVHHIILESKIWNNVYGVHYLINVLKFKSLMHLGVDSGPRAADAYLFDPVNGCNLDMVLKVLHVVHARLEVPKHVQVHRVKCWPFLFTGIAHRKHARSRFQ